MKKVKIKQPEDIVSALLCEMYDKLAAKMVVALYNEKMRLVKELGRKYEDTLLSKRKRTIKRKGRT